MLNIESKIWWRSISRFFENFQVSNSWLLYYIRLHYIINWKVFKLMASSEFLCSPSSKVWGMFVHVVNDLLFMLAPCMYLLLVFCCLTRKMNYKQCFNALVETIVNILSVQAVFILSVQAVSCWGDQKSYSALTRQCSRIDECIHKIYLKSYLA